MGWTDELDPEKLQPVWDRRLVAVQQMVAEEGQRILNGED